MPKKSIYVIKSNKGWNVKKSGRVVSSHRTQKTAIDKAISKAKKEKTEVIIQGRDGQYRSKDSYGSDPPSIKDTEH